MVIKQDMFLDQWQQTAANVTIESVQTEQCKQHQVRLDMLRLDRIHPQLSGNKWYKLKYNLLAALEANKNNILSFGGAYSNHLHALAYAGKQFNFKTIGIIRGDEQRTTTLEDCLHWGMQLHFMPRSLYRNRNENEFMFDIQARYPDAYIIPEGGNNKAGIRGCEEIVSNFSKTEYTHIACAVGTGATLQGLLRSVSNEVEVLGFSALSKCDQERQQLFQLFPTKRWQLLPDNFFGGFARSNATLLQFQHAFNFQHNIELDMVYTAKMMFHLHQLIEQGYFPKQSNILAIHTGGLQGNRSILKQA